jgi:2-polyprenyl-3-methyl-5-hydroxy-6-metoxy-1,4-benzoquinol methylase
MDMKNSINPCPVCHSEDRMTIRMGYTFIRHQDFMPMKTQPTQLAKCNFCQMIYMGENKVIHELEEIFHGEEYIRNKKTEHLIFQKKDTTTTTLPTTYSYMAEIIDKHIDKKSGLHILDIGCFDGKLLLELDRKYPRSTLHGFDVSEFISEIFPKAGNFTYFCKDLNRITDRYDVICIVNTLMYIDDLSSLMKTIDALLKPNGFVFLVTTNVQRNPYFLICGDQYTHPTPTSLQNFLNHYGFEAELITDNPAFPRSIIGLARPWKRDSMVSFKPDATLENSVRYLEKAAVALKKAATQHMEEKSDHRVSVLGSTNNAAWAYSILGDTINFFVDENPYRVGRTFYGKKVVHPSDLGPSDLLLIPYGETSKGITEKFSAIYKAKLFAI